MRDLIEKLAEDGEAAIEQLRAQRVQENVELEFKGKASPGNGELTRDDRKNLGVALSALSNSMGGLLIWGVIAAKNEDQIDCASDLQPISQIERFKNEIERALSQALMPRHDGIQVLAIPCAAVAGSGYLVIHVERSERRPHRCEFTEKQYFKRIGDSSIAMEHYDIEDSFKRIIVPTLQVEYQLLNGGRSGGAEGQFAIVRVLIILRNTSQVSARFPYLFITETKGIEVSQGRIYRGLEQAPGHFEGGADDVIHPDLGFFTLSLDRQFPLRDIYLARGTLEPPITIACRFGCLNSRPASGTLTIMEKQIAAALNIPIA